MSVSIDTSEALAKAQERQKAAQQAKEAAEQAKADAAQKDTEAAAAVTKESGEADAADAKVVQLNAEVAAIKTRYDSANVRVSTANTAYMNAQTQLTQAQASGDEDAIARAQSAVDRAYQELQNAQNEADKIKQELDAKTQEVKDAEETAKKERDEAVQAQANAEEAKSALADAEAYLATKTAELEAANAALQEAEAAAQAEETEATDETEEVNGNNDFTPLTEEEAVAQGYTIIKSVEDLKAIANNPSGKYILMGDIDLEGINWTPIGDESSPFTGELNGNGYGIKNLLIDVTDQANAKNVGFFGVTDNATISNIDFIDAKVKAADDFINGASGIGIVAGLAKSTTFNNITVSGEVSGYEGVGALAGKIDDVAYYDMLGNPVVERNSLISNVDTNVNAQGKYYVGGLIGHVQDTSTKEGVARGDLKITNCNTSGTINFSEEAAGGLIGEAGKTIITINNCQSSVNITWDNEENDGDLSFLMETGRAGGFIGCANGTYIAICNSEYKGNLDVDGDFKGEWYGWYMNDAQVTIYELSGGLPIDDILNIDGVDALTPIVDSTTGVSHYEVTVSTLTGLDKMVSMIQANPALADIVTFNVNFDFEAMDGMYDPSIYEQYGVVQHLYEDEDGNVHNDVYIDNEIDLETTFHKGESASSSCFNGMCSGDCEPLEMTMVKGLYKDQEGNYVVNTEQGLKTVHMNFNSDGQITSVTKRLDTDEVRFREYITSMVQYYQQKMYAAIRELFALAEGEELPMLNKAEYKKLLKMQEAGIELTNQQKAAIAAYEVDYTVMNIVADATHNYGCGMGGNASFLDASKAIQMTDEEGRPLFTTLNGDQLRQRMGEDGTLMVDDEGNPVYENLDGSDYTGLAEVFAQRGYPKADEDGNFLYTDKDGNTITQIKDEEGNVTYKNADGSVYEGSADDLKQQLDPYNNSDEYKGIENKMNGLLTDVENGKYPLGRTSGKNETEGNAETGSADGSEESPDGTNGVGATPPTTPEGDNSEESDDDEHKKKEEEPEV